MFIWPPWSLNISLIQRKSILPNEYNRCIVYSVAGSLPDTAGLRTGNETPGTPIGIQLSGPPLWDSVKCSSLMQFSAHLYGCQWFPLMLPFLLLAFSLLWTIQALNTIHLQQCNIYYIIKWFYKTNLIPFTTVGTSVTHFVKRTSFKNPTCPSTGLYKAHVDSWAASYLRHAQRPLCASHKPAMLEVPIDWSTDCLDLVKCCSNVNVFIKHL